jgi:fatty acid desaturase
MCMATSITDPVHQPSAGAGLTGLLFGGLVRDERDLPFVRLALWLTALFIPLALWMFMPGQFRWWQAAIYWTLYLAYLGPYVLMLHNTTHRALFKRELLNLYIPWVVGPFVGMSPETYAAHHMGIHHAEGNLPRDLSSTMPYQRDSFVDFLKYWGSFMVGHYTISKYFLRTGRKKLLRRFWLGELSYALLCGVALYVNWRPALLVFVLPMLFTRFMLMVGNWTQHAFIDPDDPTNDYRCVVTFINSTYNHRCFNDGYHLGHHLKGNRHWLDMPTDFLSKKEEMIAQQSLVFQQLDYFMIFVLLMTKRYRTLARFAVSLEPEVPWDADELIALFHQRLRKFDPETLEALAA